MNWRKNIILIVGGGIALFLLIIAFVFFFKSKREYGRLNNELGQAMSRLETLTRRSPYPSAENIKQVDANLESLKNAVGVLQETLQRGQVVAESIEPADFASLLERVSKRLYRSAAEAGVTLPDRFTLGLARYAAGEQPAREAVPRLVIQLKDLEAICQTLLQSHIQSIVSVDREAFEGGAAAQAQPDDSAGLRRRRATDDSQSPTVATAYMPMPASNTLYEVERFNVTFQGRDAAVWEALNQLAKSPLLITVVDVQLSNLASDKLGVAVPVSPLNADKNSPTFNPALARYPSHDERIIAGRELVQATFVLDVYRLVREIKEDES